MNKVSNKLLSNKEMCVCITLVLAKFMYTCVPPKQFILSKYFPDNNSYKDSFILF